MKKILCFVLCFIMLFMLVACGSNINNDNAENSEATIAAPKYNLSYGEKFAFWGETNEISKPEIPALTWDEKEVEGVLQYKTNSPIEFDMNKLAEQLKQNSFAREMFENIYAYSSENHLGTDSSKFGYYTKFTENNNVVGKNSNNQTSLSFSASREPDRQNGWYTIEVRFSNLPKDKFTQDDIYKMAKLVFGNYTDFLIYGKDTDNSSERNGDSSDKYKLKECEMVDFVGTETNSYCLRREISVGNTDTFSIFLGLRVYNNEHADTQAYFFDDRSNLYVENAYTPDTVLSANFGVADPAKGTEFGVACLNKHLSNFTTGKIEYWSLSEFTNEQGLSTYNFAINVRGENAGKI